MRRGVANQAPASAQDAQAVRRVEQTLERCRPACWLVEHAALDGTPSRHEDPAESIVATSHVCAALASRVDVESHQRLELRAGFRVHAHLKPAPRAPHVIARAPPEPPARRRLHDHENDRSHNHRTPSRHARSPILSRSRLRRSTYGSLRYTNATHVMANKSTIATPALAIPPRLRTSRPSLNHSSSARTGSAPSVARGTTYRKYSPTGVSSSRQACHRTRPANRTLGMAVPSATPAIPIVRARMMLNPRFTKPATRNPIVGRPGLPRPIRIGSATPRTGRKTRYEIVRIRSTWPAGCSKDGSIHHAMNRGPRTMRNNPAIIVSERAILDHLRKISRSSDVRPCVFSRVAIGITTAAIAMMNSIR